MLNIQTRYSLSNLSLSLVILQPRPCTGVLNAILTIFTDILLSVLTSEIVEISGGFLALEVGNLKWFSFEFVLKLALASLGVKFDQIFVK